MIYGVDFLKRANLGQPQWVGEHVVIIGGGYTAMDSSRTALRLGAKTSHHRLPPRPRRDGRGRGGAARDPLRGRAVRVLRLAGRGPAPARTARSTGMMFQRTRLGPPDATGRRSAEPIPGSEFVIPCDMVIPCTSQASDNNVLGEYGAKLNRHVGVTDTRAVVEGGSLSSWRTEPLNGTTPKDAGRAADERADVRLQPRQRGDQRRHVRHEPRTASSRSATS